MKSSYVSLNSWNEPGVIYSAENPVEIISGSTDEWPRFEERLRKYQRASIDTPHPSGAAVGYFTYEGDFWFGFFPELTVRRAEQVDSTWLERRQAGTSIDTWGEPISRMSQADFENRVEQIREYIRAGDIYQVNLARQFTASGTGNPYRLFESLMARSPAPGSAFIDTGDRQILCSSPELFVKIQGRHIVTRPIKGTRPRDRDPLLDGQLAYELMTDPKELAELIMITDLERNDLGQVCKYGSVTVTDLVRLEKYPQVYHLVSTVEGELRPDITPLQAVRSCFPGGSITGAPKKRAMEIIRELELGPRGIYTGAIGYFGFNGDTSLTMTIRTVVCETDHLHFHVGSGITIDSNPKREYEETCHKAAGIQQALRQLRTEANIKQVTCRNERI